MADTLANLEAVYSKWAEKGPYQNGTTHATTSKNGPNKNLQDYNAVIVRGKGWWKERFSSIGPPPIRPDCYSRRPRRRLGHNDGPMYSQASSSGSNLASFKLMPMVMPPGERSRRPYMGRCCACMPTSKLENHEHGVENDPMRDILRVHTMNKKNGWWTRTFCHISYCLERDVGHKYPDVSMAVHTSPKVIEAIQNAALQELGVDQMDQADAKKLQKEKAKQKKRTNSIVKQMRATISNRLIRLTGWFLHKLMGRLFSSVVVHTGQMKVLANVCQRDLPVIFLPTHQSHMDYILLTFILFNHDLRAPHVAAGDNLRIPFFGTLMRSLGGYFIQRKLDGKPGKRDFIYRSVLHTYMQELLRRGQFFEFFIEGGRTRTGKVLYPKGGLLSIIVDCYLDGIIPDVYLAPVTISYEKLLDGNFTTELQGLPKAQETFWRACSAIWRVIWGKFGNVRIDFAQPFSLKEYLAVCQSQLVAGGVADEDPLSLAPMSRSYSSNISIYSDITADDHRLTVQSLAQHVIHSCTRLRAVMSTHMVAFLLLTKHREGVSIDRLSVDMEVLIEDLRGRGRDVGFTGEMRDVIMHGCELLGDHIVKIEQKSNQKKKRTEGDQNNNPSVLFVRPVMCMHRTLELSYYANAIVPDFALESILAFCLLSELEAQNWPAMWTGEEGPTVKKSELSTASKHLIHLMHVEFNIKSPCGDFDTVIDDSISKLQAWDVLTIDEEACTEDRAFANRISKTMRFVDSEDEDSEDEREYAIPDITYKIVTERHSISRLRFLHSVLAPLLETYYIVMIESTHLATTPKTEKEFISQTHQLLMNRIHTNVASHVESANQVSVKTAVQALRQLHLVEVKETKDGSADTSSTPPELTVGNDSKEHVQRLLDLLVNFNPSPLGLRTDLESASLPAST